MVSTRTKPSKPTAAPTKPTTTSTPKPTAAREPTPESNDDGMEVVVVDLTSPPADQAGDQNSPPSPHGENARAAAEPPAVATQDPSPDLLVGSAGVSRAETPARTNNQDQGSPATQPAPPAPPSPATNPADAWAAFAAQRDAATKASRTKDVGNHRPSMADLAPLLAKHAAGNLSFQDTLPLQKHDQREVVGWLHMDTGTHTKSINEDAAMASLLLDNHSTVKGEVLVDVIKCERDLPNRMLRWGIASNDALRQLEGVSLKLRILAAGGKAKSTTMMSFPLSLPHALDGFFLDIPSGLQGHLEERLLFETLQRLEPRFLLGMYTSVSATTGMAGSRYRLHFLGSEIPPSMLVDGRMVEEFIFRGRCLRVYGRGWFFRDKRLARIDLDIPTGKPEPRKPAEPSPHPTHEPLAKPAKRQKTASKDPNEWSDVRRKKSSTANLAHPVHTPGRPWASPNAFDALAERWTIRHTAHTATHGANTFETFVPELLGAETDPSIPTMGEYVVCPVPHKGKISHVEMPIDDILAELHSLESQTAAAVAQHPAMVEAATTHAEFDLPLLVKECRVDTICVSMSRSPVDFGLQLHHLFAHDRHTFELLVR
ncbi:Aste57867_8068 [Aphanomyces stellatus]|uniref:Aste57867_8068 protein n=1 Tax=Aphanomyces stellatus TaxID=120398 RepID=A0A485KJA0_9STRA|nr:hypothetical protein As57867_008038 [Aphanomyces stellatus]VFT84958.1 Aste57867_8068 [Aphanomyces stellatus]